MSALCVECGTAPVPGTRKGTRFCSGKCRTVANRRDRAIRAYAALGAALPGGSKLWPKGVDPARLAASAPRLLDACETARGAVFALVEMLTAEMTGQSNFDLRHLNCRALADVAEELTAAIAEARQ